MNAAEPGAWSILTEEAKAEHKLKRQYNAVNMLQQVYFMDACEAFGSVAGLEEAADEARALVDHRDHQRFLLRHLLTLPEDTYAKDPLLDEPDVFTIQFMPGHGIRSSDIAAFSLVSRSWHVAWRAWLVSAAARPFWQGVCASMKLNVPILHPELCTKEMLLEWVRLPMAVGKREQWVRCSFGMAQDGDSEAITEIELGAAIARFFALVWNVQEGGPCPFAWWADFQPFLDGTTHETEADPGMHELTTGDVPKSLLSTLCNAIEDFCLDQFVDAPRIVRYELHMMLRGLMEHFKLIIRSPNLGTDWRYVPISDEQNAAFYALLRRYAPLFPQRSDQEPAVEVQPKFAEGKQHPYPMPRPEERPLMPTPYNEFLCFDETNTDEDQETWGFDHAMFGESKTIEMASGFDYPGFD